MHKLSKSSNISVDHRQWNKCCGGVCVSVYGIAQTPLYLQRNSYAHTHPHTHSFTRKQSALFKYRITAGERVRKEREGGRETHSPHEPYGMILFERTSPSTSVPKQAGCVSHFKCRTQRSKINFILSTWLELLSYDRLIQDRDEVTDRDRVLEKKPAEGDQKSENKHWQQVNRNNSQLKQMVLKLNQNSFRT